MQTIKSPPKSVKGSNKQKHKEWPNDPVVPFLSKEGGEDLDQVGGGEGIWSEHIVCKEN